MEISDIPILEISRKSYDAIAPKILSFLASTWSQVSYPLSYEYKANLFSQCESDEFFLGFCFAINKITF